MAQLRIAILQGGDDLLIAACDGVVRLVDDEIINGAAAQDLRQALFALQLLHRANHNLRPTLVAVGHDNACTALTGRPELPQAVIRLGHKFRSVTENNCTVSIT